MNKGEPTQLYHLATDIGENRNVLKADPNIVHRLKKHLQVSTKDIAKIVGQPRL